MASRIQSVRSDETTSLHHVSGQFDAGPNARHHPGESAQNSRRVVKHRSSAAKIHIVGPEFAFPTRIFGPFCIMTTARPGCGVTRAMHRARPCRHKERHRRVANLAEE